jgi:hypothetical protein
VSKWPHGNMPTQKPMPVGRRPKCLACGKELKPIYEWGAGYWEGTMQQRLEWKKANPKVFSGKYGGYGDNRFCGLNCGYNYAIRFTGGR